MNKNESPEQEFDSLCKCYKYPTNTKGYRSLKKIFIAKKHGSYITTLEGISDFSASDTARMLKQLSFSKGAFSLIVGGINKDYNNPWLVEQLQTALSTLLAEKVRKDESGLLITLGAPSETPLYASYIAYDQVHETQEKQFTTEDLNLLIEYGERHRQRVKRMMGNKQLRIPEAGQIAYCILNNVDFGDDTYLPENWEATTKMNFIFDFLLAAGFLDSRGEQWLEEATTKSRKEKQAEVKSWINSFRNATDSIPE